MRISVQQAAFDPGQALSDFAANLGGAGAAGALVSFTGLVRDLPGGDLAAMRLEHYPGMTETALERFADQACKRWDLCDCLIIHRYGDLAPGEAIMMVATAAPHRRAAFEAADFLMDYLKSRAPFWKKEFRHTDKGGTDKLGGEWVIAKDDDEAALTRWSAATPAGADDPDDPGGAGG